MKNRIIRSAALLLCVLLIAAAFAGCAEGKTRLSGKIAHIYGGTLLIAGDDGQLYFAAIGDADTSGEKLAPGQHAEMEYRGGLKETYPAEMNKLEKITLTGEASNIVDLYVGIAKEVTGGKTAGIAYDFSEDQHLTAAEQQAVGYICWTEMDAEPYYGTEEELLKEGILTEQGGAVYMRGGCVLRFAQGLEDPNLLTVKVRRTFEEEETYVYQLAESGGEWTNNLIEAPEEQ